MKNDVISSAPLEAALWHAQHEWYVLPVEPGGKRPIIARWPTAATTDKATIMGWWRDNPSANLGVACGASHLVVIDADKLESLHALSTEIPGLEDTVVSVTPRGGRHVFFTYDGDPPIRNSTSSLADGIDVRAVGGCVVLPPSVGPNGREYRWLPGHSPHERAVAPLPRALAERLLRVDTPASSAPGELGGAAQGEHVLGAGSRNSTLASIAGFLRHKGLGELAIADGLRGINRHCQPPLSDKEVAAVARSISRYPAGSGSQSEVLPLPQGVLLPDELATEGSPWLDQYISFSRRWSPRAFEGYHEACGVWVLSTVAARRVRYDFGGPKFTSVFIALVGRTSVHAKSTTRDIARDVLRAAGLHGLLAPDDSTPRRFIADLGGRVPANYDQVAGDRRTVADMRLAFTGQRGWAIEEFGGLLASMSSSDGMMADFHALLRLLDDCPPTLEYATLGRGTDYVELPYLALLVCLTPADLRTTSRPGSRYWRDGFWARFAFVAPPAEQPLPIERFPRGTRVVPAALSTPLREWHERLGMPTVKVDQVRGPDGRPTDRQLTVDRPPDTILQLNDDVWEQAYRYADALRDLVVASDDEDLDGSYTRLSEKALRMAVLFASLEGCRDVELRHLARGQAITERWRANLHALYAQMSAPAQKARGDAQKVMDVVGRLGGAAKPYEVAQRVRGLDTEGARTILKRLVEDGKVVEVRHQGAVAYAQAVESEAAQA